MLLRGRLTIAAGFLGLAIALWTALAGVGSDASAEQHPSDALPDVAAFGAEHGDGAELAVDPIEPALPQPVPPPPAEVPIANPEPPAPRKEPGGKARPAPPEILARIPVPLPRAGAAGLPSLIASTEGDGEPRDPSGPSDRVVEMVPLTAERGGASAPLRVEYTLDADLTRAIYEIFERGRVNLGLAVVLDPATGDVLAYAGTDARRLPPGEVYPAASLVKVLTTTAALESIPGAVNRTCKYVGNPYRLTASRVTPPKRGTEISLQRALAMSNNQCFAQLAVNDLGARRMLETFKRFGLLQTPGPGHEAGQAADPHGDRYELGKLGSGLAGLQITALHAAEIAATLADGTRRAPRWIERVTDARGRELALPPAAAPVTVMKPGLAAQLRELMTATTQSGTARRAFRGVYGRPILKAMDVAAKTGSLSGKTPPGRYEWFIGLAPAERPKVAIAVLVVQSKKWHTTGSQVGAQVLNAIFCSRGVCRPDRADQWLAADLASPPASGARASNPPVE